MGGTTGDMETTNLSSLAFSAGREFFALNGMMVMNLGC